MMFMTMILVGILHVLIQGSNKIGTLRSQSDNIVKADTLTYEFNTGLFPVHSFTKFYTK